MAVVDPTTVWGLYWLAAVAAAVEVLIRAVENALRWEDPANLGYCWYAALVTAVAFAAAPPWLVGFVILLVMWHGLVDLAWRWYSKSADRRVTARRLSDVERDYLLTYEWLADVMEAGRRWVELVEVLEAWRRRAPYDPVVRRRLRLARRQVKVAALANPS